MEGEPTGLLRPAQNGVRMMMLQPYRISDDSRSCSASQVRGLQQALFGASHRDQQEKMRSKDQKEEEERLEAKSRWRRTGFMIHVPRHGARR